MVSNELLWLFYGWIDVLWWKIPSTHDSSNSISLACKVELIIMIVYWWNCTKMSLLYWFILLCISIYDELFIYVWVGYLSLVGMIMVIFCCYVDIGELSQSLIIAGLFLYGWSTYAIGVYLLFLLRFCPWKHYEVNWSEFYIIVQKMA